MQKKSNPAALLPILVFLILLYFRTGILPHKAPPNLLSTLSRAMI